MNLRFNIFALSLIGLILSIFLTSPCLGKEIKEMTAFTKDDRVLILAPHPDDEAIGAAGVIQRALKAGAKVKVVLFTSGDHNEFAFIVYEKRLTFRRGEFVHMGEIRRLETMGTMRSLGLAESDVTFLGYPDFGTLEILTKYWESSRPFKDGLTRISKVPYPEALSPNAPYTGESILKDIKKVLIDFKPTKVFVSHPADTNRDHRSLYLFLHIALWDLEGAIKTPPEVFPYLIHVVGWPMPRGYHPEISLRPPEALKESGISWRELTLTDDEIEMKRNTISFYKSQNELSSSYLYTFARRNEIFGDYPAVRLRAQSADPIQWQDVHAAKKNEERYVSGLAYARKGDDLMIKLGLKRKFDADFGITVFLLGYNKDKGFAAMPKIRVHAGLDGLHVWDKKSVISNKGVTSVTEKKSLIINVPLSLLGDPTYVLACTKTAVRDLPFSDTAWRILRLE